MRRNGTIRFIAYAVVCAVLLSATGCGRRPDTTGGANLSGALTVYYLDVGQADSELVVFPGGSAMLIDAGNGSDGLLIADFLRKMKITSLDILVLTHPHEDHLGGAEVIIENFDIGTVYMPKVKDSAVPATESYENVIDALSESGAAVIRANNGVTVYSDENVSARILSPFGDYDELNLYSAVVRVTYGDTGFLFEGDAEAENEKEMLAGGCDLKADVLKVGHHGSDYSTTAAFIKAVSPKYAVISVGAGNSYGHPSNTVINRLYEYGTEMVYRTDINGTVIAKSDGETVTITTDSGIMLDGGR